MPLSPLGIYQHQQTRKWDTSEVDFAEQIGAQLGVAMQHASLGPATQADWQHPSPLPQTIGHLLALSQIL